MCCSRSTASRCASIEDYRRLTARARPGDILTLYLYKPELEQRAHTRDRRQRSTDRRMKPRILVIDDEAAIRDSLRMILEYEDYEFVGAASGPGGLAQRQARRARTWCCSTSRCRA